MLPKGCKLFLECSVYSYAHFSAKLTILLQFFNQFRYVQDKAIAIGLAAAGTTAQKLYFPKGDVNVKAIYIAQVLKKFFGVPYRLLRRL